MSDMVFRLAESLPRKGRPARRRHRGWVYFGDQGETHGSRDYTLQAIERAKAWATARGEIRLAAAFENYRRTCYREGWPSAINTYDDQILTWGTGFGRGALNDVWRSLDQEVRNELIFMVPGRCSPTGIQVNESVRLDQDIIQSLIYVAENEPFRHSVFTAQVKVFLKRTMGINSLQVLDDARYLDADPEVLYLASRLVHWTPAIFSFPADFYRAMRIAQRFPSAVAAETLAIYCAAIINVYSVKLLQSNNRAENRASGGRILRPDRNRAYTTVQISKWQTRLRQLTVRNRLQITAAVRAIVPSLTSPVAPFFDLHSDDSAIPAGHNVVCETFGGAMRYMDVGPPA